MKMSEVVILCTIATFFGTSSLHAKQTVQRECSYTFFTMVTEKDGLQQGDVDWRVTVANKGRSGRVIVKNSGDYKARAKSFESGAVEFVFRTQVSKETMTIGVTGEALWDIKFDNGDVLIYTGTCDTPKSTS